MSFVKRSDKVMFMETEMGTFNRMMGFTSLSTEKNPVEYTRQYVDDDFETTDIVAMSPSTDFEFDQKSDDPVHGKLVDIIDEEKLGDEAIISLLQVDMTKPGALGEGESFKATKRDFAVVPGSEGGELEAYTYGGTFRVKGERIKGEATTTDNWKTCEFTEDII